MDVSAALVKSTQAPSTTRHGVLRSMSHQRGGRRLSSNDPMKTARQGSASCQSCMQSCTKFFDNSNIEAPVRGYLHRRNGSGAECLILTHGAGADCESPLLKALAEAFCEAGLFVLRCDLPFRQSRSHGPPLRGSAEKDQNGLRAAVASMRREGAGRVFLGGHSYGGRQVSMLAAKECGIAERLLLLSYPLHPPKLPAQLRTQHFPFLHTPVYFAHGTRDAFGSIAEMESALEPIPARTELLEVPNAGHELMTSRNRKELIPKIVSQFLSFAR